MIRRILVGAVLSACVACHAPSKGLTCDAPAQFGHDFAGHCPTARGAIRDATDPGASQIGLTPKRVTLTELAQMARPADPLPDSRVTPAETTVYEVRDVTVTSVETDGDGEYSLTLSEGGATMRALVPYPSCLGTKSPFYCLATQARADTDDALAPTSAPQTVHQVATLVGIGFFTPSPTTADASNGLTLSPVLRICFGAGC